MKLSRTALAALLLAGTANAQVAQPPRTINVTRDEENAINALATAAAQPNRPAQDAARLANYLEVHAGKNPFPLDAGPTSRAVPAGQK